MRRKILIFFITIFNVLFHEIICENETTATTTTTTTTTTTKATTTASNVTKFSTTLPSTLNHPTDSAAKTKNVTFWYGKTINSTDILGCDWPWDFQSRYNYCYAKSFPINTDVNQTMIKNNLANFGYGILDQTLMDILLLCNANEECEIFKQSLVIEEHAKFWWRNIASLATFRKCLKLNVENMAKLCDDYSQISQISRGMAGLYLNLIDIILGTFIKVDSVEKSTESSKPIEYNEPNSLCALKTTELVHTTAAIYIKSLFYWKNSVLCWDESRTHQTDCQPICRDFAQSLQCLDESCSSKDVYKQFAIWSWYFNDNGIAKNNCAISFRSDKCNLARFTNASDAATRNMSQARRLFENVKETYKQFKGQIEHAFHIPFYTFMSIILSMLVVFIAIVSLICMWYNGALCKRNSTIVRYAKIVNSGNHGRSSKLQVPVDETRSLTRDVDDIE